MLSNTSSSPALTSRLGLAASRDASGGGKRVREERKTVAPREGDEWRAVAGRTPSAPTAPQAATTTATASVPMCRARVVEPRRRGTSQSDDAQHLGLYNSETENLAYLGVAPPSPSRLLVSK